jgi:peroxiredoxin
MSGPAHDPTALPDDLPVPEDDGACDHLQGRELPQVALASTDGDELDLSAVPGRVVIFCFPRAGRPGVPLPDGWNDIPGARGCTPQSIGFRDRFDEIRALHAQVVGVSVQSLDDLAEIASRLKLPFPLLSDQALDFACGLDLPTFEAAGMTLLKRVTLIALDGVIEKVFYPVFPPDRAAEEVIVWLLAHPHRPGETGSPA